MGSNNHGEDTSEQIKDHTEIQKQHENKPDRFESAEESQIKISDNFEIIEHQSNDIETFEDSKVNTEQDNHKASHNISYSENLAVTQSESNQEDLRNRPSNEIKEKSPTKISDDFELIEHQDTDGRVFKQQNTEQNDNRISCNSSEVVTELSFQTDLTKVDKKEESFSED